MTPGRTWRRWAVVILCAVAALRGDRADARVLVIGVDGASWNVLDPMLEAGELPNLSALAKRGFTADLATVEPVTSPVVWTSVATGRSPDVHGVKDFWKTRLDVQVPTVYERLAQAGVPVGLYEVLMTWPPVELPGGFVVPGWLRRDDVVLPSEAAAPEGNAIFRTVYEGKRSNTVYFEQAGREVTQKADGWRALDRTYRPEVGALTFYAVDATSHRFWHLAFPDGVEGPAPNSEAERDAIFDAIRGVDREIGRILEGYGPEDTILILSDHGFQEVDSPSLIWVTDFDEMIRGKDLDPERDGFTKIGTFFGVSIRIAPGPVEERDRTIEKLIEVFDSYQTVDGDPLFFTNVLDVADRPPGHERSIGNRLWQMGLRLVTQYVFGLEMDPTAQAVVTALPRSSTLKALWPDGEIDAGGVRRPLQEVLYQQQFTGTHHPTAVFIAAGGAIQPATERGELSVLDVAPLVLYAAGQPIPDDLEGRLPVEYLDPERLEARPPQTVAAAEYPGLPDDGRVGLPKSDPQLTDRLRALGYLNE